jgi:site-specific DNA-cytosine methylase
METKPSLISLEGYRDLRPLNQDIVDITEPLMGQGLVVVELCGGILSATEALLRTGVKIRELHVCEIDLEARALAAARLEMLSKTFPELLAPKAFARCFSSLPQDIASIKHKHVRELGPVDLIICGFPCQGFSQASRGAQGLRDSRSAAFFDMVNLIHKITYEHGNCGWVIENVNASDHNNRLVREEYNQVVKGVLEEGYAFDAVAVGSYAHRFRRFWTNLIPTTLLHKMVEKQFESRSSEQSVQDILETGRRAQLAQHDRAPGPHSVNTVGEPLKAFSTFVTLKWSDAYRSHAQSLVFTQQQELVPPSLSDGERAMGFMGGMSQSLTPPLDEASCLRLLRGSMNLFQLTFLFGSILAFQKGLLEF